MTKQNRTCWSENMPGDHGDCRRWRALAGIALGVLLCSGCSPKETADTAPTVTVQVETAEKEAIQRKILADAILYPREQASIVPKISSPVKRFYVNRGSPVKAGQLLAELEGQDLAGAQLKSQGGVQQAEAAYQMQLQKVVQDQELAKQTLEAAQKLLDNRAALYKEGAISAKDMEDANVALTQARNQYELAQKQVDLKIAQGQLNAAKGDSASADAQLSYTKITSPINGVVTDRPVNTGETSAPGAPILTVMDLSEVIARAHVSQTEASALKAGDPATIFVAGENAEVKGKVTLVSPALDPNSTTVEVWVEAANPGGRFRPGSSVQIAMIGETVNNAIVIPASALQTAADGSSSVIVLDANNIPHKNKIKTGIRDAEHVQVVEGLQAGERVVTMGAFELDREDDDVLAKSKIQVQAPNKTGEDDAK
jgi:RND family efflux transporter MFP subunit